MKKFPKITKTERIALLEEPTNSWSYREIMKYFDYSQGKANELMKNLPCPKLYEGKTAGKRVYIDAVLNLFGTTKNKELR